MIKIGCVRCNSLVEVNTKRDVIDGTVYINIPGVVCPDCIDDILDEIPDPPGLVGFKQLSLKVACEMVANNTFINDIIKSVKFFCSLFKGFPEIYDQGAVRLHMNGLVSEGYEILDRGIKECKNVDLLLVEKAAFLDMDNKPEDAINVLTRVKNHNANRYYIIYGNLLRKIDRWDEAATYWKKAIPTDKHDIVGWNNLGYYYLNVKKDFASA